MMKKLIIFTIITLTQTFVFSQDTTDSIYDKNIEALFIKSYPFIYRNQDSASFYLDKAKKLSKQNNDVGIFITSVHLSNRSAAYFYNFDKMRSNIKLLDSIIKNHNNLINESTTPYVLKNRVNFDKGVYNYKINNFKTSKQAFSSIISTTKKLPDSIYNREGRDFTATSYNFIAKMNTIDEKYDLAKELYLKNIRYIEKYISTDKKIINRTYSLLAEVLKNQKQFNKSNTYFSKSLKYYINNKGDLSDIATIANQLIENHLALKQIDSANYYLNIIKNNFEENHPRANIYYEAKAEIHKVNKDYNKSAIALVKSLTLVKQKWNNQPHNDIAETYNKLGDLYSKAGKPNKAVTNLLIQ